jgi:hypothetical protein
MGKRTSASKKSHEKTVPPIFTSAVRRPQHLMRILLAVRRRMVRHDAEGGSSVDQKALARNAVCSKKQLAAIGRVCAGTVNSVNTVPAA